MSTGYFMLGIERKAADLRFWIPKRSAGHPLVYLATANPSWGPWVLRPPILVLNKQAMSYSFRAGLQP